MNRAVAVRLAVSRTHLESIVEGWLTEFLGDASAIDAIVAPRAGRRRTATARRSRRRSRRDLVGLRTGRESRDPASVGEGDRGDHADRRHHHRCRRRARAGPLPNRPHRHARPKGRRPSGLTRRRVKPFCSPSRQCRSGWRWSAASGRCPWRSPGPHARPQSGAVARPRPPFPRSHPAQRRQIDRRTRRGTQGWTPPFHPHRSARLCRTGHHHGDSGRAPADRTLRRADVDHGRFGEGLAAAATRTRVRMIRRAASRSSKHDPHCSGGDFRSVVASLGDLHRIPRCTPKAAAEPGTFKGYHRTGLEKYPGRTDAESGTE